MPKLTINGKEVEVEKGRNLIQAAHDAGAEIPHFCYHPGLSVAGNCRMCLVEIQGARTLEIACNTQAADGMIVNTESPKVLKARQGVMEFLLLNHPIDCPVCDCAGECYLQDYYMEHDKKESRLVEGKTKKKKATDIGTHVMLDTERCVLCSRCVRFTDEVSHSHELGIFGRGSTEEIGLSDGKRLENPYSGNVVDICPVGALTDKQFRFKSRPWYLEDTETVCNGCSQGCNIILNTNPNSYNKVGEDRAYRIYPRENTEVNQYWICDEGRYSYPAIDRNRLSGALKQGSPYPLESALSEAASGLQKVLSEKGTAAFLLSPQLTLEELWAWRWLAGKLGISQVEFGDEIKAIGSSDNYLIKADKNPNSRGASELGLGVRAGVLGAKELLKAAGEGKFQALMVVEHDLSKTLETAGVKALAGSLKFFAVLNAHQDETTRAAHWAVPRAVYAEQDGAFINAWGRVQRVRRAMDPLGASLTGWQAAFKLGALLGHKAPAEKAAEVFRLAAAEIPALAGLDHEALGRKGQNLKTPVPA
jgi:NADH-quinone oxidoreductase subunit G